MRLETTAGQMRTALSCMRGVIERRNTIPVLGCIKVEAGHLVGTNLDNEIRVALPTIGKASGAACLDWRGLSTLAGHVDSGETLVVADDGGCASIAFNGSNYRLPSLPASEFPDFAMPDMAKTSSGNMGLVAAMRRVAFAVSNEETRYYLNGVALLNSPDGPVLAATDGHRLATAPLPFIPEGAAGAIIPRRTVHWLTARKTEPESLAISTEKYRASFDFAGLSLKAKLIDGTYPDIYRVMPKNPTPVFSVDRSTALRVLQRLAAFSSSLGRGEVGVKLEGEESLRFSMKRGGDASASETIAFVAAPQKPFATGFNVHYLVDALTRLTGDTVTFSAAEDDAGRVELAGIPVEITSDNDLLKIVQMPMRV